MSGMDDNVDGDQIAKLVDRRSDLCARGGRGELPADRSGSRLKARAGQRARRGFSVEARFGASHREALTAIKDGRFEQALGFYRTLPASEWEADDCLKLGEALLERDRLALGGAAFEAARRIDPEHLPSAQALDALQGKMALATGSDRAALHEAASRGELLRKIPTRAAAGATRPRIGLRIRATRSRRMNFSIDSTVITTRGCTRSIQPVGRSR